jgi:hypothetical protein
MRQGASSPTRITESPIVSPVSRTLPAGSVSLPEQLGGPKSFAIKCNRFRRRAIEDQVRHGAMKTSGYRRCLRHRDCLSHFEANALKHHDAPGHVISTKCHKFGSPRDAAIRRKLTIHVPPENSKDNSKSVMVLRTLRQKGKPPRTPFSG